MQNLGIRTILLIEDNAGDSDLIKDFLKQRFESLDKLVHAQSLAQAKIELESQEVDVVLLDLRLPDGTGLECVREIRRVTSDIPIVVLTGIDDEKLALECIAEGAQDYLMKDETRSQSLRRAVGYAIARSHELLQRKRSNILQERLADELLKRNEELARDQQMRALAKRLDEVRETERARISRTVHDELGQMLTGIKIDLSWMTKNLPESVDKNNFLSRLSEAQKLADLAVEKIQKIAIELRPSALDVLGLAAAVRDDAHRFEKRTGITVKVDILSSSNPDSKTAITLFRILQELLTNIVRHAQAKTVNITIAERNQAWFMRVEDDGVGFKLEEKSWRSSLGLLGIRERAQILNGVVEIDGRLGRGASVKITIPERKQAEE